MPEIRVVIADDQQLLRQSLVHLLDHQPGIRVVAEAATGVEAVSVTRELAPSAVTTLVERWLPTETPRGNVAGLTPRQTQILRLVARGLSNEQIERELHISHATCKTHISALLSRLQARDRAQLVIAAYENGLVSPGSPN